ncbi:MAG: hypothetical protein AVDCRST_MAG77-5041 [uncultured Chloroflexi bacterium]|uniref:Uncharacterized protein n=1 Tax=uncultured Chloroflexota bacterium TaxID=166587 RepID=A0A6J4K3I1_9CHLR|nr:MAG: hypothetical protein AVDCRST_MAG77-5041 [uncultured Chloroflexota bacterium]
MPEPPPPAGSPRSSTAIGHPFILWTQLEGALDPPIRPLVEALNATGWALTVFSCGGHPDEPDSVLRGRRQAHVDVVVSDLGRWRRAIAAMKRQLRRDVRLTEGDLGQAPPWLQAHLPAHQLGGARWSYRRLVFEPRPYDAPADAVRATLDAAISTALGVLAALQADTVSPAT